jgi:hypothetical protein
MPIIVRECKKPNLDHLGCLMDALVWLESIKNIGLAKTPVKAKKRKYLLDRSFSVNHFLFHIEDDKVYLAFGDNGSAKSWFVNLPWREIRVMDGQDPHLLLITQKINCPTLPGSSSFDSDFKVSEFAIRIPIYPDFIDVLDFDSISMATFEFSKGKILLVEKSSQSVPLVSFS